MTASNQIEIAAQRFKTLSSNGFSKGRFLPNWLEKKSFILTKEYQRETPRFYNEYKNGHIVMIDFGTNIGSEFCNNHFAIVLNKDDNKRNSMLTVIPLTSKEKNFYHKLNDEVFKLVNNQITKDITDVKKQLEAYTKNTKKIEEIRSKLVSPTGHSKRETNDDDLLQIELKNLEESTRDELNKMQIKLDKLIKVSEKYTKFSNDSFACIRNIQTISKSRIIKLNDLDPSGKIRLSKATMGGLDLKILEVFTNIKLSS